MELEHDGSVPFLGTVLTRCDDTTENQPTENQPTRDCYSISKATSTADIRKAWSTRWLTVRTVYLPPKVRTVFSKLHYPKRLVDSSIDKFSQEPDKEIYPLPSADPSVYIVLPFIDQRSADRVRRDIYSLGAKIDVNVKPIFTSKKLLQTLSVKETSPRSLTLNALCTYFNVICAMQIMSGTLPDTYINA